MPFQAIPIALRSNPGTPLSKLLWIHVVEQARVQEGRKGSCYLETTIFDLVHFCNADEAQVKEALAHLHRCDLITILQELEESLFIWVNLPISELDDGERKRLKASPDQIKRIAMRCGYRCIACGFESRDLSDWHVDHIIPRSVGGADVEENCQVLCATCNSRKGAKVHWVDFIGGRR